MIFLTYLLIKVFGLNAWDSEVSKLCIPIYDNVHDDDKDLEVKGTIRKISKNASISKMSKDRKLSN